MSLKSNLDLVRECDNFPYPSPTLTTPFLTPSPAQAQTQPQCWNFICATHNVGLMRDYIYERIAWSAATTAETFILHRRTRCIELRGADYAQRTSRLAAFLQRLREEKVFAVLDGWRDELYPIYGEKKEVLFSIERSAAPLFGVVSYGVHMTGFVRGKGDGGEGGMRIWIPTRAETKQTYPGMMDNTVGGGLATGERVLDGLVREAVEEASLDEEMVRRHAKPAGTVTYFYLRGESAGGETGLLQPECQYVYDLELEEEVVLKPNDEEVAKFELMTVEEVKRALGEGLFKTNCAVVMLDFFIRHGIVGPENEPDYVEIVSRIHRRFEMPVA